ncbi:hypothetical protein CTAYLR_000014 [Chrysophaeum taylorii]|uniref:Uncharacterized protein n=1 Tax=Chrysophaeum taylorii TaxID=2483200 RepID=A0AAD7UHY8_9STRA|nr:hypothetical protein CTAYLR_000014 [Chrysophaeum taylorii]
MMMEVSCIPRLSRSFATVPVMASTNRTLREQILRGYGELPFRGQPIYVGEGVLVAEDAWACALQLEVTAREAFGTLSAFDLEAWLKDRINLEGTLSDRIAFETLVANLDGGGGFEAGYLPEKITDILQSPLKEVDPCRGLDDDFFFFDFFCKEKHEEEQQE